MPRPAVLLRLLPLLLLGALTGCGDHDRVSTAAELDEPAYRDGLALLKTGRKQEALNSFLKVIDLRGDDAPESHLEVGLLYLQDINDPLSAIYHFKKYLALRPNSPQAPLVKQRIDAAMRDFARMLPAQSLENQPLRVDLVAALDRLKQENQMLKQELTDLKGDRMVAAQDEKTPGAAASATSGHFNFSGETVPTVRTRPAPPAPVRATTVKNTPAKASTPVPAPARRHIIQQGDTLSKIAQQYYGNRARWRDIFAANRNVMKNETDLKVGVELKIP